MRVAEPAQRERGHQEGPQADERGPKPLDHRPTPPQKQPGPGPKAGTVAGGSARSPRCPRPGRSDSSRRTSRRTSARARSTARPEAPAPARFSAPAKPPAVPQANQRKGPARTTGGRKRRPRSPSARAAANATGRPTWRRSYRGSRSRARRSRGQTRRSRRHSKSKTVDTPATTATRPAKPKTYPPPPPALSNRSFCPTNKNAPRKANSGVANRPMWPLQASAGSISVCKRTTHTAASLRIASTLTAR